MNLVFNPERLSRKITRKEWLEIWRWKRVTEKQLKRSLEEKIALLVAKADIPLHIRKDMIDVIVNPPLLVYPDIGSNYDIDLRPGAISYVR